MKEINGKKSYTLLILIVASTLCLAFLAAIGTKGIITTKTRTPPPRRLWHRQCAESTINSI